MYKLGLEETEEIASIHWILKKARNFRKTSTSASLTTLKLLTLRITTNCGEFLELGIPDHLSCLPRNLYAGQETTVRTGHVTMDWFKIGKEIHQCYILSPCLFSLYANYIMQKAGLDKSQAGFEIARRNINHLRYADDTTLRGTKEPLDASERGE